MFAVVSQIAEEFSALVETRRQFLGIAIDWEDEWDSDEDLFAAIRNSAAGKSAFEQRFNVAVSRARDRLYLYRSFRREDLKEKDLRARLLEHWPHRCTATPRRRAANAANPISSVLSLIA